MGIPMGYLAFLPFKKSHYEAKSLDKWLRYH